MESGDGGWIWPEAAQPDGERGVRSAGGEDLDGDWELDEEDGWPEDDWPEDGWSQNGWPHHGWAHDGWPRDGWPEYGWPATTAAGFTPGSAAGPPAGRRWGHGGVPGFSAWVAVAVAAAAATAGVAVGLFLVSGTPPTAPSPFSASATAGSGQLQVAISGRVLAVSRTSITIGGAGPSVTAAVTGATTITGRAHSIGGVKDGDQVSAQLTGTAAHLTATAIADLAGALPGQPAGTVRRGRTTCYRGATGGGAA
jgi:hypothetical protein